jgi:glycosyltransferase involved in cell wall biosynthesis
MRVLAVIPAYNEATRIGAVVRSGAQAYVSEVIVVDDGSTDGTGGMRRLRVRRVIRHMDNCGPGAATMTGIEAARLLGADCHHYAGCRRAA